ncbi:MAG: hypothetical protein ACYSU0_02640 [Planctomycetota bacterium]
MVRNAACILSILFACLLLVSAFMLVTGQCEILAVPPPPAKAPTPAGSTPAKWDARGKALDWLAQEQRPDGSWEGGLVEWEPARAAVTGLAVLPFLAECNTEKTGKHKETVRKAVNWIIDNQDASGAVGKGSPGSPAVNHALCGLALAEAYGMGRVKATGEAAQRAVDHSVKVLQTEGSGWGNEPGADPELRVTAWFVMQLKSAVVAGLEVPKEGFIGAIGFLDKVTAMNGSRIGTCSNRPGEPPTAEMTARGALCRQFMGWKRDDPLLRGAAMRLLADAHELETAAGIVDPQHLYFVRLVAFRTGGELWRTCYRVTEDRITKAQCVEGENAGSWGAVAWLPLSRGKVADTAFSSVCLSIYYRGGLPLYK